ncbi:MAG TPA: hypothetical protein VJ987_02790 [Anaerolineales bacterium]|nr:hypothetical protein [Anaerolineales bacterium]
MNTARVALILIFMSSFTNLAGAMDIYFATPDSSAKSDDDRCLKLEDTTLENELEDAGAKLVRPAMRDQYGKRYVYAVNRRNLPLTLFESEQTCLEWHRAAYWDESSKLPGPGVWEYVFHKDHKPSRECIKTSVVDNLADVFPYVMKLNNPYNVNVPGSLSKDNKSQMIEIWKDGMWTPSYFTSSEKRCETLVRVMQRASEAITRSAYAARDDARKTPSDKQWWAPNSTFTRCVGTGGPADKLDEFVGYADRPYTQDFRNSKGEVIKVEVINVTGGDRETVWVYYKDKGHCEAEQINATKSLADKYR